MHADTKPYPPASVVGAIVLSKLDVPQGRHALDIIAVGLVTGLLDRYSAEASTKRSSTVTFSPRQVWSSPTRFIKKPE